MTVLTIRIDSYNVTAKPSSGVQSYRVNITQSLQRRRKNIQFGHGFSIADKIRHLSEINRRRGDKRGGDKIRFVD